MNRLFRGNGKLINDFIVFLSDDTVWSYRSGDVYAAGRRYEDNTVEGCLRNVWKEIPLTRELEAGLRLLVPVLWYPFVMETLKRK